MVKYIAAAAALIFGVLYAFGGEDRRAAVSRTSSDNVGISLATFMPQDAAVAVTRLETSMSPADAVKTAMAAAKAVREMRPAKVLIGEVVAASETVEQSEILVEAAPIPSYWYVTGSKVNLRSGPGTTNAVVGQLGKGDAAEVLGDTSGWYQIRTADGSLAGWIHGDFLAKG